VSLYWEGDGITLSNKTDPFELASRIAGLTRPELDSLDVHDPRSLLEALAAASDSQGRYWANPRYIAGGLLCGTIDRHVIASWLDALMASGDVTIEMSTKDCYGGSDIAILTIQNRRRFRRFSRRQQISETLRLAVYERDGWQCVQCEARSALTLDHIHPWSLGGADSYENLRTLCRPCNSSKGAKVL
jgi:hypothetical protein